MRYNNNRYGEVHIKPNKIYSLSEMSRIIPWFTDIRSCKKLVERDENMLQILEVEKKGSGVGTSYHIKGRSIIKFIKVYGPGIEIIITKNHANKKPRSSTSRED